MVVKKKPGKHKRKVSQDPKGKPAADRGSPKGLTRRQLLKYGLGGGLGLAAAGAGYWWWPRRKAPNIILIVIDTLRADSLGCYGHPEVISPELDHLAQSGVQFTDVIAQCSWTRPSIGYLVTSLYPRTVGIYEEHTGILNSKYLTLPQILQHHGYRTIGITANPNINSIFNFHQGFDDYVDSNVVWRWMAKKKDELPYRPNKLMSAPDAFARVFDIVDSKNHLPCYIQINIMEMHEAGNGRMIRPEYRYVNFNYPNPVRRYLQSIKQVSKDTGDFIKSLSSRPGWDNTLFVITSDHGEGLLDHPNLPKSYGHGYYLYESQLKVPLIFYKPNWDLKNTKVKTTVRLLDLMPTILDFAGIPIPKSIVGKSLLPLFHDVNADIGLPDRFFAETKFRVVDKTAVYSPQWEYIENIDNLPGTNMYELQHRGIKENGKLTDQIHKHKSLAKTLQAYLQSWKVEFSATESTPLKNEIPKETLEQLRSLGYFR